ncbi:MAG: Bcr/CflA family efflux MFS transporter [Bacteroidota bacterium]|nr:Bcr/CflA family efflux MFS transporter [Bacteroidota bacterium]
METYAQNKVASSTDTILPQRNAQQTFFLILLLGLLDTLTPFSIDMYLPAFPPIAKDLHTTVENMSLSVSFYFLGFAIGQIVYGPLLDRFGRKLPLYKGLVLYIFATLGCAACHTLNALLLMRFVQALGGCVGSVAAIALVQDLFPPEKSASIISFLILVIGLSPLLAPSVGSFVLTFWGWHGVFIVLAVIAAILLLIAFFFLPAGAPPDTSVSLMPKPILKVFRQIITQPQFFVYAFAGTFAFAPLFIYVAGSPAVFMNFF